MMLVVFAVLISDARYDRYLAIYHVKIFYIVMVENLYIINHNSGSYSRDNQEVGVAHGVKSPEN